MHRPGEGFHRDGNERRAGVLGRTCSCCRTGAAAPRRQVATWYRGQHFVYPALGENAKPLHPLLAWWAVLYALSMLARYEPCAWQKRIDIDGSKESAAIEHLLGAALDFLPALIRDTVNKVS
ncbi:YaaC family protein [Streptomyces mirabilis]|uniref:YaaC family protein n=1 Tax=Streptomyces mirabilis TaxID=68239 RepID=UPI0036818755